MVPCALGRTGRTHRKKEGDGATPIGSFALLTVLYRADRLPRPRTRLPVRAIRPRDGWCDEPRDRNYNRRVTHPYPSSAEHLWREDDLYDLVVVPAHNHRPRIRGAGSAIFIHLARPDFAPTAGCVAFRRPDLLRLIASLTPHSRLVVLP